MKKISAIIIARNEREDLPACLESVKWADEIIVIDNGSTDKTADIAEKFGAKVYEYKAPANEGHFGEIREYAAKKASGDYLLYIDADERVTLALKKEIELAISLQPSAFSSYAIPRKNILLGKEMHHGGWWPDYVLRLIRKDALLGYEGKLHEQPKIRGDVGKLVNPLIHITHKNLTEMVEKTNKWSEIEAKLLFESGHPKMNIIRFCSVAAREFWHRAVVKMGFLDGTVGWIEIIYQVYSRLITYSKLWEMQIIPKTKNQNIEHKF